MNGYIAFMLARELTSKSFKDDQTAGARREPANAGSVRRNRAHRREHGRRRLQSLGWGFARRS